ncbi:hypothetical protein E5F05_20625 [Deinococcus metallilatus]|uniref:Uncharacterized protein n=1 Tax=Deinococcus metallilatus TaxID=1211322 RepID=A0AAJ5F5P8_9DEIO|nr:hypothetical protein [Deinococcus metallilatus]MBB5294377.1 hypothetical protein [Deinococcus metallilatus]QBY10133.1 hypothetical protein E5F05_20625 [Deinococcus metallilatus]RXJ13859.1 hypothetical protein ERJ73_04275 [Deinococcus metallilatus]TLK29825.1 hypothetical protein FCS05_04590 [Deinococcus metallilatus]GMA15593.1 hypothetical protein GCM10025871_19240 [Deinococcus metallilatus]
MLTVNLHLCNGDLVTLQVTPSQRDRLSRTLNQTVLPNTPFEVHVDGRTLMIPWRSIGYLSILTEARPSPELQSTEAAD